ncbi:methyl-accepting chemotaxis sensory transducer with Pas/Pac sensor [Methanoplanus limicola DSM 2279]|uniref:Methyl-accepting chemotaxis sensory transducer with Pas/Pac sensor n=2 Tax=Methanoplanus limicola TaxID=2315 RepID=H1YZ77_9EURY|nr:methyl-accepting chemotaxis sensory transducer with Pas/Pac sensor [Methanoplanus limicola DSM 2279]
MFTVLTVPDAELRIIIMYNRIYLRLNPIFREDFINIWCIYMDFRIIEDAIDRAVSGDASVRVNEADISGDLRFLAGKVNCLIEKNRVLNDAAIMQARFESFLTNNPQAVAVLAADRRIIYLNREYERLWRGTHDELIAKNLYDFDINIVGGDDLYASYRTKKNAVSELEIRWKNGEKSYVRLFQTPVINADGEIDVSYYTFQDMTHEREEMEEIERLQKRAETFLKENPQAITVLASDKHRLDLNKEYERAWRGSYSELMAKKLYDFDIEITGGDDFYASYDTKRKAVTDMTISWKDRTQTHLRLFQCPILDENGEIDVNYYIYQDRTAEVSQSDYMNREVERVSANLEMLARGELDMNLSVGEADEYTGDYRALMEKINTNLGMAKDGIHNLVIEAEKIAEISSRGRFDERSDTSKLTGDYRKVIEGFNRALDMISAPLGESMNVIEAFANNDYSVRFRDNIPAEGDFSKFKMSINGLGETLVDVIGDVIKAVVHVSVGTSEASKGSDEVAKATEDVAMTSQKCADLSKSVLEQMESIQMQIADLSASNQEVAATSADVLKNAENVTKMGNDAQALGNDANGKMNRVEEITSRSVSEIEVLNDQIKEINSILKMINEIAGQINLLALNAAIEAARAGEHGRGFAVVAGEVKNLAGDARKATDHIEKVISGIQKNSRKTAEGIKQANNEVVSSVKSVDATIQALNQIVTGAKEVTEDMGDIARAIENQANIANNVVHATDVGTEKTRENLREVEELAALAEEASASVEEIGSAIHEVNEMSGILKKDMDKFRISGRR